MAKSRLYRILSRIIDIRPGEEIIASLLFLYFFFIMCPYYIIKPYRDAKYIIKEGSEYLPIAYLTTAIVVGIVVAFYSRLQARVPRRVLIILCLVFFMVTCLISQRLFVKEEKFAWMPLVFWVWANLFIVVLGTQFWMLVNDVFNPREAKRLIGFFGSGGLLGGIFGALLTGFLGRKYPDNLLLIAFGILILSIFVVNLIFIWQRRKGSPDDKAEKKDKEKGVKPAKVGFIDCFNTVRKNHYLTLLAVVVILTFIVATFIDYQSKTVIDIHEDRMDEMTSLFGYFHAALLVIPFLISMFMTSGIIKRFGIRSTLLLFPLLLLLCAFGIGIWPVFGWALAIKTSDKSLSFSLNQFTRELLYIPILPELKYKAKVFIDMFLNRFAKGLGALILMIFLIPFFRDFTQPSLMQKAEILEKPGVLETTDESQRIDESELVDKRIRRVRFASAFSVVFIFAWIFFNLKVSKEYTKTVKKKLEIKWDRADRMVAEKMDVDYTKLVFDTIESRNRSSILYAMHIFDLIKQDKLTPEVKKLISYKSDEVKASSLGGLFESGETALLPETDEIIGEDVLEKEIGEIMALDVYQEVMKSYVENALRDESLESETAKMEVAKAIGLMGSESPLAEKLGELLWDESPEVSKYALESAAKLRKKEYVPALIKKLFNPITREDASVALEKYGDRVIGALSDYLSDRDEDVELRRGTTSVLARIGTQDAGDCLMWELEEGKGEIDTELIDALDRIRCEKPGVQFREDIVETKILREIKKYCLTFIKHFGTKSKRKKAEKTKSLPEELNVSLMNVFKLLGLIYLREDIMRAYQNIQVGTKDSVDYAIELLDNTLKKEMREIILPLMEELALEERVKRCRSCLKNFSKPNRKSA
jgi:AAA family ATP:ADP antiporter